MSKENNGGPAFLSQGYKGLTIRDYFAAKAMQSIPLSIVPNERNLIAKAAYQMADAMLKAREES